MPRLLQYLEDGELQPDIIISHRMKLADAARGYEMFEEKQDDCRKVVLTPELVNARRHCSLTPC
jgi:threonine dehydrogenase-like Zn-dependent dehydrogenase